MLGRLYQITLCFLLAMQPASRSLSTDLYFRLAETGHPVLVTLVDTAAAELTTTIADHLELDKHHDNSTESDLDYDNPPDTFEAMFPASDDSTVETLNSQVINESRDNLKIQNLSVDSRAKEDELQSEELKDVGSIVGDADIPIVVPVKSENSTSDLESAKKVDVVIASEVQEEIPSFAEWAQKQLEEAEKNKENGVNDSSQSTQGAVSSNVNLKVRSKNYASLDCGAKIVAANPESGSSSFILSPSRDEYMLNTCNSRIWFVVELCEAIQAKKVDLANFELFSSTPKNFSVFVSDRFPTREWASVGQFIAKDERDIQTFNLHPHLFGKFIKVELHSYYGSEHYCPISLFRVYGTSEYEVFETENSPHLPSNQGPDEEEYIALELLKDKESLELSKNLFGSARDAVMSIMKKAAQVLVKSGDSKNSSETVQSSPLDVKKCKTPSHIIVCDNCSNSVFSNVYDLMSCESEALNGLLASPLISNALCNTDMCRQYGLDFKTKRTSSIETEIASYISALLIPSYVAALCNMLAIIEKKVVLNTSYETDLNVTTNLTIDKKVQKEIDAGKLNDLLQAPFSTCTEELDHPSCRGKMTEDFKPDIMPSITSSVPSDVESSSLTDIKPTKTLQKDYDSTEPSVLTVDTGYEQRDKNYINNQNIESSIASNVDEKATETLTKEEPAKIINDSSKDVPIDAIKSDAPDENGSLTHHDVTFDSDSLHLEVTEDANIKLSTQEQISLDNLLSELEQVNVDPATPAPFNNAAPALSHQGQKESVFLRLSNRIKALERNMSLSAQYLEELSRRYKKQMEEMQRTFEKTVITMNEESKKAEEREHKSSEEMVFLQQQIAHLSTAVSTLLTDRESWFGTVSLLKVMFFQIFLTTFIVYIMRRKPCTNIIVPERKVSKVRPSVSKENPKMRRKSTEGMVSNVSEEQRQARRRRPSEEALSIARIVTDKHENSVKNEKKKRKRKSPIKRSNSITTPNVIIIDPPQTATPITPIEDIWVRPDLRKIDTPIALDEAEFILPEIEPIDFCRMGDVPAKPPNINGITPKKEFPKTNGSIFGKKTPEVDKSGKIRRLSSPAFFRAALNRQSSRSGTSEISARGVSPIVETLPLNIEFVEREIRSEERVARSGTESPQLSTWSSIGDVSEASSAAKDDTPTAKKKRKGRSLKQIFKKVF